VATRDAVWFVGDTGVDIECARNSGCVSILLGPAPAGIEQPDCAPHWLCPDCETLLRLAGIL
jgi:phosphoglycolate phosphatase